MYRRAAIFKRKELVTHNTRALLNDISELLRRYRQRESPLKALTGAPSEASWDTIKVFSLRL